MAVTKPRSPNSRTNGVNSAVTTPVTIFTVQLVPNQVMRINVKAIGRQLSSFGRALFERAGLFYTDGSQSFVQGPTWTASVTEKTDTGFDIVYSLGTTSVDIQVKNAHAISTNWFGRLDTDVV